MKKKIKSIRNELRKEIEVSINQYWMDRITKIHPKNKKKIFPEINKLFRKKDSLSLPTLKILPKDIGLFDEANINVNLLQTDSEKNYLITNSKQIRYYGGSLCID